MADKWYCSNNLDAEHRECSVAQEMLDAAIVELNKVDRGLSAD